MNRSTILVRLASVLVLVALFIELGSLFWSHPLSFLAFAIFGGAALGSGVILYFYWLIASSRDQQPAPQSTKE